MSNDMEGTQRMIFHQLFDDASSTYTYLLACPRSREAALIDPVRERVAEYLDLLLREDLRLRYSLETHVHADHVTASGLLRERLGCETVVSDAGVACADRAVSDGELLPLGALVIEVRATPGHTSTDVSYVIGDRVFTGDALFVGGCGRTDFQGGDAGRLYDSVHSRLFSLPPETLVFPAHDYNGRTHSTIGAERAHNPRLGAGRSRESFVALMRELVLPKPAQIERALPANRACGRESEG